MEILLAAAVRHVEVRRALFEVRAGLAIRTGPKVGLYTVAQARHSARHGAIEPATLHAGAADPRVAQVTDTLFLVGHVGLPDCSWNQRAVYNANEVFP